MWVGFVIGGIGTDFNYLNEIEVLAPEMTCNGQIMPDYPLKVIGSSAGFILGQNLVCGGATYDYAECDVHSEGSFICDRNVDCIQTHKGPEWCTGQKTNKCFSYDPIQKVFNVSFHLPSKSIVFLSRLGLSKLLYAQKELMQLLSLYQTGHFGF